MVKDNPRSTVSKIFGAIESFVKYSGEVIAGDIAARLIYGTARAGYRLYLYGRALVMSQNFRHWLAGNATPIQKAVLKTMTKHQLKLAALQILHSLPFADAATIDANSPAFKRWLYRQERRQKIEDRMTKIPDAPLPEVQRQPLPLLPRLAGHAAAFTIPYFYGLRRVHGLLQND